MLWSLKIQVQHQSHHLRIYRAVTTNLTYQLLRRLQFCHHCICHLRVMPTLKRWLFLEKGHMMKLQTQVIILRASGLITNGWEAGEEVEAAWIQRLDLVDLPRFMSKTFPRAWTLLHIWIIISQDSALWSTFRYIYYLPMVCCGHFSRFSETILGRARSIMSDNYMRDLEFVLKNCALPLEPTSFSIKLMQYLYPALCWKY